ncbi:MAG: phage tail tape measure protein [Planctomycetes bacterium]|nr:phage tail tape measure protein [Planctomycetota bacterium]
MASRADVQAGKAFVLLYLKNDMGRQLGRALKSAGSNLQSAGLRMAGIGAGMLAPFVMGAREFANFDAAMGNVATMLDDVEGFLPGFTTGIKNMAVEFGKTKDDLATGLYDILSATVPPALAMERLAAATKLASAGNAEVGSSVSVLNTLMDTYGDSFKDAADASDFLFAIVKRGRTNLTELSGSLGNIIATAKAAGMSVEDMGAAVALLTRATGGTDTALTALNAISATFLKPATEGAALWKSKFGEAMDANTLKAIGMTGVLERMSTLGAGDIAKIFPNLRALRGIFPAISKMAGFSDDLAGMADRAGNVSEAFEKIKGPLFDWKRGLEQGKEVMLEIGKAVVTAILPYKDSILEIGKSTAAWVKDNSGLVVTVGKLGVALLAAGAATTLLGVALWGTGVTLSTLGTSLAFLIANPVVLGIAAIAAVFGTLAYAVHGTESRVTNLSNAMSRLRIDGEKLIATDRTRLERLKALSEAGKLNDAQMQESRNLIRLLEGRYGDLGVVLNETTRAITGLSEAMEEYNARMRAMEVAPIVREIEALQADMAQLQATISDLRAWDPLKAAVLGAENQIEGLAQTYKEKAEQISALLLKIGSGAPGAAAGGPPPSGAAGAILPPGVGDGAEEAASKIEQFNKQVTERLRDLRVQAIQDEEYRALTAIEVKYKAERDAARAIGADFTKLEEARQAEIANMKAGFRQQEEAEEKAAAKRIADQRAVLEQDVAGQIARLKIETGPGTEIEKRKKLLELDRQDALARAREIGADEAAIQRLYDLKAQALGAGTTSAARGVALTATYSAAAARISGYQPGGGPEKKMAEGIVAIERNTKELTQLQQEFLAGWRVA